MNNLCNIFNRLMIFVLTLAVLANWAALPVSCANNLTAPASADATATPVLVDQATRSRVSEAYGNLPISFEANQGQFDSRVKFVSRGNGCTMFLTTNEAVLQLQVGAPADKHIPPSIETENPKPAMPDSQLASLRMKLVGASAAPVAQGMNELPGKVNYFIGNDPKKWRTGIATYAKALFKQVYPGVDVVYYGNQKELEYDVKVAPGASYRVVRLAFEGARRIRIDKRGDLVLSTAAGEIRQRKPVAYQEVSGTRKEIPARFVMKGARQVGFEIARYDTGRPLVIDPALSYSTYLGGDNFDSGSGIAVDASGNAYIGGQTSSFDFPVTASLQPVPLESFNAFITKLNATGTALVYSTILGGNSSETGFSLAIDAAGNAYLTGDTFSTDFPLMNPIQPTNAGSDEAFITKLNSTGSALVYSTYLGGSGIDFGEAIAVDAGGRAYVTGITSSNNFPTVNALQSVRGRFQDGFIAKINPAGTAFDYSTYIGGSGSDTARSIAADSDGNAYVAGSTISSDFPTSNALQPAFKGRTAFKSVNGATSWADINNGLPASFTINALAFDPANTSTLYAATAGGGVSKSTNGGNSWNPVNNGLFPTTGFEAVAISPADSNTVFAGSVGGIFKSTNGGMSWSGNSIGNALSIAIDPVNPANIYVGGRNFISKSTDGGNTWVTGLVFVTGFGGGTGAIRSIAIDPSAPSTIYLGGDFLVFKSTDGGANWTLNSTGLLNRQINALVIDPTNTSTLYVGTSTSVFKSTNGAGNWTRVGPIFKSTINDVVVDPVTPTTLYAATLGEGVFKSTDGGNTWVNMSNGMSNSFANALAIDPGNPSTVYSGNFPVGDGFVLKLNPNGSQLIYSTYIGGDNGDSCSAIAVDAFGNAYVTGTTTATDFPTVNSSRIYSGSGDAFAFKLNSAGTALVYSTYIGGSGVDSGSGIAIDSGGNAYIVGDTASTDFPTVAALQSSLGNAAGDAFVTKLNATGTAFDYSTYLGGGNGPGGIEGADLGNAIAVDAGGNAYVTGATFSADFPTTPGAFQITQNGMGDAFISKISIFDICLQDDANGNLLEFNSTTGEYKFSNCRKKFTLTGRGTVSTKFCKVELKANASGHSITASANTCVHNGSATVLVSAQRQTYTVSDKNTTNNTCSCQ